MPAQEQPEAQTIKSPSKKAEMTNSFIERVKAWFSKDKSFTDWMMAACTLVLAIVAVEQAFILNNQLVEMRDDKRALVGFNGVENTPTVLKGQFGEVVVKVRNFGKTPAIKLRSIITGELKNRGEMPDFQYPKFNKEEQSSAVLEPEAPYEIYTKSEQSWNPADLGQLVSGDKVLYIYADIDYEDVFKKAHHTKFCFFILPHTPNLDRTQMCHDYNSAD